MRSQRLVKLARSIPPRISIRPIICAPLLAPKSARSRSHKDIKWARSHSSHAAPHSTIQSNESWSLNDSDSTPIRGDSTHEHIAAVIRNVRHLLQKGIGGSNVWLDRLAVADADLHHTRRRTVAVIGDSTADPKSVVSALLQDPLAESSTARHMLLQRHEDANRDSLRLSFGHQPVDSLDTLHVPCSWLQNSDIDLLEIQAGTSKSAIDSAALADLVLLVVDPIRLGSLALIESIKPLLLAGRPIAIVVNGTLPPGATPAKCAEQLREQFQLAEPSRPSAATIHFADSSLALEAFDALAGALQQASPSTRSRAFELFQHAYLGSNFGQLQRYLTDAIPADYQARTAASIIAMTTAFISNTLAADRHALEVAQRAIVDLRKSARDAALHAKNISVINRSIDGGLIEGGVDDELHRARHDIQTMFDGRLSWLGLVARLRVDDVASELAAYVTQRFGVDLERQVIYETGQLDQIREHLDKDTDSTVRRMSMVRINGSDHPLASPILRNHLSSLSLSIPSFSPNTLLTPLHRRRRQLVDTAIHALQVSARRTLLATSGLAAAGIVTSWWLFVPPVAVLSATTAVGLSALSALSAAAWGQKRWGKAQKTFWLDWTRTTGMLQGDLQEIFGSAVETRVLAKTRAAADGLDTLLQKREKRLEELSEELSRVVV